MFSGRRASELPATHDTTQPLPFHSILQRARNRESEALGALYRQFLPGVFGYIAARIADRSIAEDLTSDVFVEVVEHIEQVKATSEASFAAWLFQIARGVVAGYYRKNQKQPMLFSLSPKTPECDGKELEYHPIASDTESDPVQWSELRAEWANVVQAINQLTEDQRQVIIGRLIMGYDVATVAQMIGKQGNAVKALQFRALQSLQRVLKQQEERPAKTIKRNQTQYPGCQQEDRS